MPTWSFLVLTVIVSVDSFVMVGLAAKLAAARSKIRELEKQ